MPSAFRRRFSARGCIVRRRATVSKEKSSNRTRGRRSRTTWSATLGRATAQYFATASSRISRLTGIGAGHRTFELVGGEDEGRLLGVEPDGRLKETVIRTDIGWRFARQQHFFRQRSAQFPDSVECERHRSIAEMVDALGSPLVDRIADQGYAVAHRQVPHAAPVIAVLVVDKILQRSAQGRRVPHQIARRGPSSLCPSVVRAEGQNVRIPFASRPPGAICPPR